MRGYGDLVQAVAWEERAKALRELAVRIDARAGSELRARHVDLVTLVIESGELAQAVIDSEMNEAGIDRWTPLHECSLALVRAAATAMIDSMRRLAEAETLSPIPGGITAAVSTHLDGLESLGAPVELDIRDAEGFSFYAVYPELYALAAQALDRPRRRTVIAARTIGTALGAVVAAALDAARLVTVRPAGHPFHRHLAIDGDLRNVILHDSDEYAIVDEGPGLSGSTFGCIADFLEANGVAPESIAFFPSHGGMPGPQADAKHVARWRSADRRVVPFESFFHGDSGLLRWAEETTGRIDRVSDIGGGAWRTHVRAAAAPPSTITREPRKYLLENDRGRWLMKFSGLGRRAERKFAKAQSLAAAGLTTPPAAAVHGFVLFEWIDGRVAEITRDAAALFDAAQRYLKWIAAHPIDGRGAPLDALFTAARDTVRINLGEEMSRQANGWTAQVNRFAAAARPVDGDQRMHIWEWLVTPSGAIVKCDALDHVRGHDGIGPQDLAWDLAGASIELRLTSDEDAALRKSLAPFRKWSDDELDFYRFLYAAAQLARCEQAESELREIWPDEAARWRAEKRRYEAEVIALLTGRERRRRDGRRGDTDRAGETQTSR